MLDEDTQPKTLWSQTQFDMLYLALDVDAQHGTRVILARTQLLHFLGRVLGEYEGLGGECALLCAHSDLCVS